MILGLIAGQWFKDGHRGLTVLRRLLLAGSLCLLGGIILDAAGICPSVKKLWTPAWTLFSGGWCFFLMAAFHLINDELRLNAWSFPLRVLGMNSILMYMLVHLAECFLATGHRLHFNGFPINVLGPIYEPAIHGALVLLLFWGLLWFLHRRRLFLRI